jgi:DNA-3-methyladenine glycosylase I
MDTILDKRTCAWALNHPIEREYHDKEWGRPNFNDKYLFEFITLEGAQAGLSWYTILKRREAYREAFKQYDLKTLIAVKQQAENLDDESHIDEIINQYDVIKHRNKIRSVFSNAEAALALEQEYGSLSAALWQFVDGSPVVNKWTTPEQVPAITEQSKAMSKFLKKKGFKFIGETICYALMQATGMVNDHLISCDCYETSKRILNEK